MLPRIKIVSLTILVAKIAPCISYINDNIKLSRGKICVANFIPPANGRVRVIISYQKVKNSLTPFTGVCGFFLSAKFPSTLLASLAGV